MFQPLPSVPDHPGLEREVLFHDGTKKAGNVAFLAGHAISSSGLYQA